MSVNVKPLEQLEFHGVYTSGNPIQRPRGTAEVCENFRVMPGNYLRLRSGRKARYNTGTWSILQIGAIRNPAFWGADNQFAQTVISGAAYWHWFLLSTYTLTDPTFRAETIATANDGGFALANPAAFCNLTDRPLVYNGLGVRDGTNSRPPFSTWDSVNGPRYFGLDCYMPGVNTPTLSFTGTGYNQWLNTMRVYVGLWHRPTDHYSNGVKIGEFLFPSADVIPPGKLTISNLSRLSYATHGSSETAELYYVFYATIDGGQIPYLVLNSSLDGPYAVAVGTASTDLSISASADTGFDLDLTHEMPTENHPPRPMRSIAYVNGRLYGVLMTGGANHASWPFAPAFTYIPTVRDKAAVVWSAASGDTLGSDFLGDPLQSWPYANIAYTPSAEQPLIVAPSLDGAYVLVLTNTSAFYLQEQVDGVHEWTTISRIHGIGNPSTLRTTKYGMVWVNQRNQIVLLQPNVTGARVGADAQIVAQDLTVLSDNYQNLMTGTVRCADYILDPEALIDRYQVWFSSGVFVCHDFMLQGPGVAYTGTGLDFTAAASPIDNSGHIHHIVANAAMYTHETQPGGGIQVTDAEFTTGQSFTSADITGVYRRNWDDFGDSDVRKEFPMLDVIGDADIAASTGVTPLTIDWYGDFDQVTGGNKHTTVGARIAQSATCPTFRYKTTAANRFWYKLVFTLIGHATDNGGVSSTYPAPASEGNNAHNFFGSILRVLWRLGIGENRA